MADMKKQFLRLNISNFEMIASDCVTTNEATNEVIFFARATS